MTLNEIATWGALGLSAVVLVLFMGHTARLRSLERRYSALLGRETSRYGAEGLPALGDLVSGQGQRLDKTVNDLAGLSGVVDTMGKTVQGSVQHVGLVRFNPFQETGGDQSFALALLDGRGDGIVISSLHSRTVTRFYAKPVKGGTSQLSLSEEEAKAVQQAMGS